MIAYFPELFPDELLYSLLARYYAKSGYAVYRCAAEDLFSNPAIRPDIELLNEYSTDALSRITQTIPIETIIEKHTMFPYYGRFLPKERRNKAFQAMVNMEGNYNNLLAFPKGKNNGNRYVHYCPVCAADDRKLYGETYWHRVHQMQGVKICPFHGCYLIDSKIIISGKTSPMLVSAEEAITNIDEIKMCKNEVEIKLAKYIASVFQSDVDFESEVLTGDFLHSRMSGTKFLSARGQQRNMTLINEAFQEYYKNLPDNWLSESWAIQKVLSNDKVNLYEVCMVSMFLGIPAPDLTNMKLPEKTQEQLFDEKINMLHAQGLKYPQIAKQLGASLDYVKVIGEGRYGRYRKKIRQPNKGGVRPNDWNNMDKELLPKVKAAIKEIQGDGITRPRKVTVFAVEKILGLRQKWIENLPLCKAEIQKHNLSQKEYWALEIAWAANKVIRDEQDFNWTNLRKLTNLRKRDFIACLPYVPKYTDNELCKKIESLQ